MRRLYWEWPIAIYLFLGGMGGGMFFLSWVLLTFVFPGTDVVVGSALTLPLFLALVWLAGGCFLLVFELGQPGVFLRVFFNSATSIIGHGARILSVCLIFGFFWWLSYLPLGALAGFFAGFRGFNIAVAGIAGFCIMLYTGVLLSTLKAHSFWASPALPVLFTISALSTAAACIMLSAAANPFHESIAVLYGALAVDEVLHMVDIILIIAELTVLLVMVLSFLGAGNKTAHAVATRWVKGKTAPWFWGGMICVGLLCPLFLNILGFTTLACVLALCGGLLLRFLIVWSDERAEIPGENRYFNKIAKGDELFITKWTRGENIY